MGFLLLAKYHMLANLIRKQSWLAFASYGHHTITLLEQAQG